MQRGHHYFTVRLVVPDRAALPADELSLVNRMASEWSSSHDPVRPGRTRQRAGKREAGTDTAADAGSPKVASDAQSQPAGDGRGGGGSSSARDQTSAGSGGRSSERNGRAVLSEEDDDDDFDAADGEADAEMGGDGQGKPRARGSGGSWGPFVSDVDDTDHNPP